VPGHKASPIQLSSEQECELKGKRYGGDRDGIELTIGAGADPGG
jgi:hypothetical protein